MPIDGLPILKSELPEVFEELPLPPNWSDDWLISPIENIEASDPLVEEDDSIERILTQELENRVSPEEPVFFDNWKSNNRLPNAGTSSQLSGIGKFPGAPQSRPQEYTPPPDCLAFYLPFHYFYPSAWGIYLYAEGVLEMAANFINFSQGSLQAKDAIALSRIFLYSHELFHHQTESFGTKLEVTHRTPIFKKGMQRLYDDTYGTDFCLEEALANAFAYQKVKAKARRMPNSKAILANLREFLKNQPPGYRMAVDYLTRPKREAGRQKFLEENHTAALSGIPSRSPKLWINFPHGLDGIARINSKVNYILHRGSPLATRTRLAGRFLRYRDLERKLTELGGCTPTGRQRGSHVIWRNRKGTTFPVPRHPGDFKTGTLNSILKKAMIDLSLHAFLRA